MSVAIQPWTTDQVLALAPDAAAQRTARGLAVARPWTEAGWSSGGDTPPSVWGLCKGSGSKPYQVCVDLAEPAYRCSCPSRKFPCKHTLGLLLYWAGGGVAEAEPTDWVREWHDGRAARAAKAATKAASAAPRTPDARTRARRANRVAEGLTELDRWLADQVRGGLAGAAQAGYAHWDGMAARLVDAQAPGAANGVRRLAGLASSGEPGRLLGEVAMLHLLASGYGRLDTLPEDLADTVRSRAGLPVASDEVLARPPVRDDWQVLGTQQEEEDRLVVRRTWLLGSGTGRPALVLGFAAPGRPLAADLVVGTTVDADLCFFPGAQPLRALVRAKHGAPVDGPPTGTVPIRAALDSYARAVARDPWLDRWPLLLAEATLIGPDGGWYVADRAGDGLPLDPAAGEPWRLVAAAGGRPVTMAGEWSPDGLRPLTVWVDGRAVRG